MIYAVFLYFLCMNEISLNWIGGMYGFVLFLWVCSEESATFIFSRTATNIENEIISCLAQVYGFDCGD